MTTDVHVIVPLNVEIPVTVALSFTRFEASAGYSGDVHPTPEMATPSFSTGVVSMVDVHSPRVREE